MRDTDISAAIGNGNRTFRIARKLGCSTAIARRQLIRLESAGSVQRHPRYSAVNDIYWTPTTLTKEPEL